MNLQIELHTPRLLLKSISPAFIHDIFANWSREKIIAYFGADDAGYDHLKNMHEKGMETHRISQLFFVLYDKNSSLPIGECGFHTLNRTHCRTELFYMLRNDSDKQKGLMGEALPVVLEFGFTTLGLHRIQAMVGAWNTPSIKLLLRNGFTKEGTMREDYRVNGKNEDSDCYSLLRWEWEKR